jgi:hypothetical protein
MMRLSWVKPILLKIQSKSSSMLLQSIQANLLCL